MSWLSSVGGWLSKNSDWLKPVTQAGAGLYDAYSQNRAADDYFGSLRAAERNNYDQKRAEYDAYLKYTQDMGAYQQQQSAASAANAAARAAAAAATERNRQGALKKAKKEETKIHNEAQGYLRPYHDTGMRLLPQVEQAYSGALANAGLLSSYLFSPEAMAQLRPGGPAYTIQVPLPKK